MSQFATLQREVGVWVERNFGTIHVDHHPYQPLLGMIEEIGELHEVLGDNRDEKLTIQTPQDVLNIVDAVGDIMVYMADYCNCMKFDLHQIAMYSVIDIYSLITASGKLCHSHLKYEQNIRGNISDHLFQIRINLARIMFKLDVLCRELGLNFMDCVFQTWDTVKQRDWKKNKENGVAHD